MGKFGKDKVRRGETIFLGGKYFCSLEEGCNICQFINYNSKILLRGSSACSRIEISFRGLNNGELSGRN